MNGKTKIVIFSVLGVLIFLGGFLIGSRPGSVSRHDHASDAHNVLELMELTSEELISLIATERERSESIINDLYASNQYVRKLENERERALGISRRSNERFIELTELMATGDGTFNDVIHRQQRINDLTRELWEDNRQLRETLSIGN